MQRSDRNAGDQKLQSPPLRSLPLPAALSNTRPPPDSSMENRFLEQR
jgi:hypothetical protein